MMAGLADLTQPLLKHSKVRRLIGIGVMIVFILLALVVAAQDRKTALTDQACGSTEIPVLAASGLEISGRCANSDSGRALRLSLTITDREQRRGRLQELSLGFCGEIVDASSPAGWAATILGRTTTSGQPATVEWRSLPETARGGDMARHIEGFVVVLKPGWRRAIRFGARWQEQSEAEGSPHDCGDWPN